MFVHLQGLTAGVLLGQVYVQKPRPRRRRRRTAGRRHQAHLLHSSDTSGVTELLHRDLSNEEKTIRGRRQPTLKSVKIAPGSCSGSHFLFQKSALERSGLDIIFRGNASTPQMPKLATSQVGEGRNTDCPSAAAPSSLGGTNPTATLVRRTKPILRLAQRNCVTSFSHVKHTHIFLIG